MNLAETRGWLSTLCAYLPHVAPYSIDPRLVRHWHVELERVPVDVAAELAQRFEAAGPDRITFPTRQEFAELRREHGGITSGQADSVQAAIAAARAAARAAPSTPRRSAA